MNDKLYKYLLENAYGKENRIKSTELMRYFDISDNRTFRKYIQNINADKKYKKLVGAVSSRTGGYFICSSEEEAQEAIKNRQNRANQMLRETHIMKWKYRKFRGR